MFRTVFAALIGFYLLAACKKDKPVVVPPMPPPAENDSSSVLLKFEATADGLPLYKDTVYQLPPGELFTVTRFSYYVSNVKLHRVDGQIFSEQESYHLVRHLENITSFTIAGVPVGTYTAIEFVIGVDSTRNVSGAQTGDLDPVHNMFWDWNSGYIFYKLEGWSRSNSSAEAEYAAHVGGFTGRYSALQKVTLQNEMVLKGNSYMNLHLSAEAAEVFRTPHPMGFDTYFMEITAADFMQRLSQNYQDMFTLRSVTYTAR